MRFFLTVMLALFPVHSGAQTEVDLELVLLVDVSRSMTERELEIQRRGYAEALASDEVYKAVLSGPLQRIAVTYVEWADTQRVIVPWRLLDDRQDFTDFARILTNEFNPALRRTSISEALIFAGREIDTNAFTGWREVIDVSGDGPNNMGRPVTRARDTVLAQGKVINGLPLMTQEGMGSAWHLDQLDLYYRTCVIGGFGAFVIPVLEWDDFADAVRRKLILEIAGMQPPLLPIPAQAASRDPTDCLIGEKIWEERRRNWEWDWQ